MVVFRLPNQTQIQCFDVGAGKAKFILAPFLKDKNQIALSGNIRTIERPELKEIIQTIKLPNSKACPSTSQIEYKKNVELAKDKLQFTALRKVVLAARKWFETNRDIYSIYDNLLNNNPNAFVYLARIDGLVMIGASPEVLLNRLSSELHTVALGGTETRGSYTEKERIEHQQIRDYIESILEDHAYQFKIHETVSVKASTVAHLKTPYTIKAKSMEEDLNLINYLHPTSAVCGLPYQDALDFIKENEGFDRSFYSGFLGAIDENNQFTLFVNLRCAELYQGGALLFAGAGINEMSSADDEWIEINNKMETIAQCLK